jgi:excisionase family DNA binding protein
MFGHRVPGKAERTVCTPLFCPGIFFWSQKEKHPVKWYSIKEAAAYLDTNEKVLRNLIYLGRFPHHKISGRVKTSEEELLKWLKLSQKVTAEEAAAQLQAGK